MSVNRGINRTSTIQHASNVIASVMDPNLCERYGTSVDEFQSKKHQVEIQKRIRELRGIFQRINKDKNSFISIDELTDFFNETKNEKDVHDIYLLIIQYRETFLSQENTSKEYSKCWTKTKTQNSYCKYKSL